MEGNKSGSRMCVRRQTGHRQFGFYLLGGEIFGCLVGGQTALTANCCVCW